MVEPQGYLGLGPRLSVGLPVHNGERFLAAALDDLLRQTFTDFELIISDNASTDGTAAICRQYAAEDPRIRYLRRRHNIGLAGNHGAVLAEARGELFKWVGDDDRYDPNLLQSCVDALDRNPGSVAAHCWSTIIDEFGNPVAEQVHCLATASPLPAERFRSLLFEVGGGEDYAVIRTDVLRRIRPPASYYGADRTLIAELALQGPFVCVPSRLYFRRDHTGRASRAPTIRAWCIVHDPRRANPWRHPAARLLLEYVGGYLTAIRLSPLGRQDRWRCYRAVIIWAVDRAGRRLASRATVPGRWRWR